MPKISSKSLRETGFFEGIKGMWHAFDRMMAKAYCIGINDNGTDKGIEAYKNFLDSQGILKKGLDKRWKV